jgi:hemerythrin
MQPESTLHGTIRRTLLTGIGEIDADHLAFADLSTELLSACISGDRARIDAAARALEPHGSSHFSSEERLLVELGYKDYDPAAFAAHVAEHKRLRGLIAAKLSQRILTTADATAIQALLAEHLLLWDVKYMSFVGRLERCVASPRP